MMLDLKPCCCGCMDFLPPWALREDWTGDEVNPGDVHVAIVCVHADVCGRRAVDSEGRQQ